MLKSCPHFLRGRLRFSFLIALRERHRAMMANDWVAEERAWKLFGLGPAMLLHRPRHTGSVGRDELAKRADDFGRGKWTELIEGARGNVQDHCSSADVVKDDARREEAAQSRVRRGQVSRVRHELTGTPLAPKTEATLADLRARRPQEQQRAISTEVVDYVPGSFLQLDAKMFTKCLRTAPSGSAPGPGGCSNEMLQVCLDDVETLGLLFSAAEDFARADRPEPTRPFLLATMTALQKKDGGVRVIATGTSFGRLVAKTLARQFGAAVEATCATFQFAFSTRAGVDCVGHAVRVATDQNWDALAWVPDLQSAWHYCSSVQGHDATISFALYLQISRPDAQLGTIWACAEQWKVSWGVFQTLRDRRSVRMSSRHCQCDSVVWVCGQQGGWHPQLSGLLGRTHSPCSPLACQS